MIAPADIERAFREVYSERIASWDDTHVQPRCSRWVSIPRLRRKTGGDVWEVGKVVRKMREEGRLVYRGRDATYSFAVCPGGFVYETSLLVARAGF